MPSKTLLEVLASKPHGQEFIAELNAIREKAAPKLEEILRTFPYYTNHDIEHSQRVVQILDSYVPDSLKDSFNELELFFLVASAYLHDIGMQRFSKSIEDKLSIDLRTSSRGNVSDEEIRGSHHLRSEAFITEYHRGLSVRDHHKALIIGRICRGHRNEDLFNRELFNPDQTYRLFQINVPLLAALLRVGDELDITFERVSSILYGQIPPDDKTSKSEWDRHLRISGVAVVHDDPLKLKSSACCDDAKIDRSLRSLEKKINEQMNEVPELLHQHRSALKDLPRQFEMDIEARGYTPSNFKFSLETEVIMHLLMGDKLYKSPTESIRELIKNSVDSCRLKKRIRGFSYNPLIEFEVARDKSKLTICDNGCGMDEYVIENFFTKVGRSYYQSSEFLQEEADFPAVSELGIGIISCFMISNRMVVETKAHNQPSFKMEIDDVADYFIVDNDTTQHEGTKITLDLTEEAKKFDFEGIVRTYARHVEIPIIIHADGRTQQISDDGYEPQITIPAGCKVQQIEIKCDEVEGIIGLILRQTEKGLGAACSAKDSYGAAHPMQFVSYEGVFVTNTSILPAWLLTKAGTGIYSDLNLKKSSSVNLNLARNELIEDEKLVRTKTIIENNAADAIRKYINELSHSSQKGGLKFNEVLVRFFKAFIHFGDLADQRSFELIADIFSKFYYFKTLSKSGWRYTSADEIRQAHKPIVVFESVPNASSSVYDSSVDWWRAPNTPYIAKMMEKCSGFSDSELYILPDYTYFSSQNIERLLDRILPHYTKKGFLTYFKFEKDTRLSDVLPGWDVCRFHNYESSRFIEFRVDYRTYLNGKNKFVRLLLDNHQTLTTQQKSRIRDFCELFEADLRGNFSIDVVQNRQISILETFKLAGIIDEADMGSFLITKHDFPPDLLEEWAG
jgi:hypothetical protein